MQSPASDEAISFITPTGFQRGPCGYCKSAPKATRASVGFSSTSITPSLYQKLVDRGWRRSGTYYYKPDALNSCCPHYTIRLDASTFKSSRDQRQAVNHWNRFVIGQDYVLKAARSCPKSREEKKRLRNHFDLAHSVHCSEYDLIPKPLDRKTSEPIRPAHSFKVNLEPDRFTEEKFFLFRNYQRNVHRENDSEIARAGFKRFLCSGLKHSTTHENGKGKRLGSYHQCYRLDGKLIAMGVLDLLPNCVSSVYLLYHQDVESWNFGKLSALREIELAVEGGYGYYYMGYYIHSCIKMRYKAAYRPQYVLDPETYHWDLLDADLLSRLDLRKYVSLSRERRLHIPIEALPLEPPEPHRRHTSIFDACTPGALTLDEVERDIALGEWKLHVQGANVQLQDLVNWDESEMSDPSTLKGLAAELAALFGPELVEQTAIKF